MGLEAFDVPRLIVKDLNHPLARDHFLDVAIGLPQFNLLLDEVFAAAFGREASEEEDEDGEA